MSRATACSHWLTTQELLVYILLVEKLLTSNISLNTISFRENISSKNYLPQAKGALLLSSLVHNVHVLI